MKNLTIIMWVMLPLFVKAQNNYTPLPLLKMRDNYALDNPASAVLSESIDLKFIHNSYTDLPGKVGLNYLNANYTFKNKSENSASIPGILIHSEYETSILQRTRLYLRYSWNTKISDDFKLSAGIHIGFFNYSIRSSNSSGGISAFAPDASIGLWLNGQKINMGISSSQLLNSEVRPISTVYFLKRYYTVITDYKIHDGSASSISIGLKGDHDGKELQNFRTGIIWDIKNLSTEVNYSYNKGIVFSLGLIQLPLLTLQSDLFFSYFYSGSKYVNNNRIEVNVRIYLPQTNLQE